MSSFLHQIWKDCITCSRKDPLQWMGAVRKRVQTADKNITIIHTTPVQQLTSCEVKSCVFVRNKYTIKMFFCDMWPSMVPILRIYALDLINPKCTHTPWTHTHTHTHRPWPHTHTVNTHPEQWAAIYAVAPGSSCRFGALLKGTSVVVLKVERTLLIHSLHLQSRRTETRTHNLWVTSTLNH